MKDYNPLTNLLTLQITIAHVKFQYVIAFIGRC
jgi:hypothetical protein